MNNYKISFLIMGKSMHRRVVHLEAETQDDALDKLAASYPTAYNIHFEQTHKDEEASALAGWKQGKKGNLTDGSTFDSTGEYGRPARMAGNIIMGNAIQIRKHYCYNGSGASAFGGAKQWPALTVRIDFPIGQELERDRIAELLAQLIDREIPLPEAEA